MILGPRRKTNKHNIMGGTVSRTGGGSSLGRLSRKGRQKKVYVFVFIVFFFVCPRYACFKRYLGRVFLK